jgi:hypothetical protein
MGSDNEEKIVRLQERNQRSLSEKVGDATVIWSKPFDRWIWIRPQQIDKNIAEKFVRLRQLLKILQAVKMWRDAPVHTKNAVIQNGRDRQRLKSVVAFSIDRIRKFVLALFEKNGLSSACQSLVIATKHMNMIWEHAFQSKKEHNNLNSKFPTIDIVSKEQKMCSRGISATLKNPQKVINVPVNITNNENLA